MLETLLLRRPKDYVVAGRPIVDLPPLRIVERKLVPTSSSLALRVSHCFVPTTQEQNMTDSHRKIYDFLFKTSSERFAQYYSEVGAPRTHSMCVSTP